MCLYERLFRPLAFRARAQRVDAESQIAGQLCQKLDFAGCKGVGFRGIDGKNTEGASVFILEGQRDAGSIATLQGAFTPRGHARVGREILGTGYFATSDDCPGGAAPPFRVRPGEPGLFEIPILESGPGDRAYGPGFIVFGIPHPGHAIPGLIANNAAYIIEQGLFVNRP